MSKIEVMLCDGHRTRENWGIGHLELKADPATVNGGEEIEFGSRLGGPEESLRMREPGEQLLQRKQG